MWSFVDEPWQYRILDHLPSGIDEAQLERARKLTPTERLEAVVELMALGESLQQGLAGKRTSR